MKKYKFAVVGAQGVGKSSLVQGLYQKCNASLDLKCELKEGIGAYIRSLGLSVGEAGDIETKYAFIAAHLKRETECISELTIFDRHMIDVAVYSYAIAGFSDNFLAMVDQIAEVSVKNFDLIFYLSIPSTLRNVGAGHETAEFRQLIDSQLQVWVTRFLISFLVYPKAYQIELKLRFRLSSQKFGCNIANSRENDSIKPVSEVGFHFLLEHHNRVEPRLKR